jgi:hypothetical protein
MLSVFDSFTAWPLYDLLSNKLILFAVANSQCFQTQPLHPMGRWAKPSTSAHTPSTSFSSSWRHHIFLRCAAFEHGKPIYEMDHEVAGERVGRGIPYIVRSHASIDVAALLQDVIYF